MVAFDAAGPSSAGTAFTATPGTWTHVNNGNGIIVGITCFNGTSNTVTGVTYGGVTVPLLVYRNTGGGLNGGFVMYGLVGPTCPTGSNTVSVSFSDAPSNHNAGSISVSGGASFGTVFTSTGNNVTSVSVTVNGTTTGGMIVTGACFGGGGGAGVFSGTNSVTVRWSHNNSNTTGADNGVGGTVPSTGGGVNQTVGFSTTETSDDWGIIAVEVLPLGGAVSSWPNRPGLSRLRSHHGARRQQIQATFGTPDIPVLGVTVPVKGPVMVSRLPSRARVGPCGGAGGGIASAIVTPLGTPSRPVPFVFRSPAPRRARTGMAGALGDGVASAIVTPLGSMPRPMPRPVIQHLPPRRAQVGPRGLEGAGFPSSIVTPLGTPGPGWRAQPRRPGPARAVQRTVAGPAVVSTPAPAPLQRPAQPRSPAPHRALAGSRGQASGGIASQVVTPLGVPSRPKPFVFRSPAPARARTGTAGALGDGVASPVVTPLGSPSSPAQRPVIQHLPPQRAQAGPMGLPGAGVASGVVTPRGTPGPSWRAQPRRPGPARAVWHGGAAPQAIAPVITAYQRPPVQFPRRPPARTVWHGYASAVVTPLGTPGPGWRAQPRRPGPSRVIWHGNAGPPAVAPVTPQAYQRSPILPRSPAPHRAVWRGGAGPAPVTAPTASIRIPPQARRPAPSRAVWRGNASRIVTPLGTPARRPGPVITSKPRSRGLWHGNTGPVPIASAAPPRWKPLPSRRSPQRGTWRRVAGTANIIPPLISPGYATTVVTDPRDGTTTVAGLRGITTVTGKTNTGTVTDPRDGTTSVTDPRDGHTTVR